MGRAGRRKDGLVRDMIPTLEANGCGIEQKRGRWAHSIKSMVVHGAFVEQTRLTSVASLHSAPSI